MKKALIYSMLFYLGICCSATVSPAGEVNPALIPEYATSSNPWTTSELSSELKINDDYSIEFNWAVLWNQQSASVNTIPDMSLDGLTINVKYSF